MNELSVTVRPQFLYTTTAALQMAPIIILGCVWIINSACLGEHTTNSKCGIFFPFH